MKTVESGNLGTFFTGKFVCVLLILYSLPDIVIDISEQKTGVVKLSIPVGIMVSV